MTISNTKAAAASSMASGLVIGVAIGTWLKDLTIGVSLGLLLGSAATSYVEYKKGKRSLGWVVLGVGAFFWVLALKLYTGG